MRIRRLRCLQQSAIARGMCKRASSKSEDLFLLGLIVLYNHGRGKFSRTNVITLCTKNGGMSWEAFFKKLTMRAYVLVFDNGALLQATQSTH